MSNTLGRPKKRDGHAYDKNVRVNDDIKTRLLDWRTSTDDKWGDMILRALNYANDHKLFTDLATVTVNTKNNSSNASSRKKGKG